MAESPIVDTPFFRVKKLCEDAILPARASPFSAGYELSSAAEINVPAKEKVFIPTYLSIAVPPGTCARIAPPSGLASTNSIDVLASVFGADCRRPVIGVIMFNHGDVDFLLQTGDRIAQLIIEKIVTPRVEQVDDLDSTQPSPKTPIVDGLVPFFRVKKLSEHAILPARVSPGYHLSSPAETTVPAKGKVFIPTYLTIAVPPGTCARIAPLAGLAWMNSIDVLAAVFGADYRGAVGVILFNHTDVDFQLKTGGRIAQLIIEKIVTPDVEVVDDLDSTQVQEPSPKIPKLDGVVSSPSTTPFFRVKKLSEHATLPARSSTFSGGYELSSADEIKVPAKGKAFIPTDLSIAVPPGTCARIAPLSGLAWKNSIDVLAGVIGADYRGAVGVSLFNHGDVDFHIKIGGRIAQLIIEKIVTPDVEVVDNLDSTVRGSGWFGV